ncbi:UFM1 specific ligase 1 [Leptinotarsa decemlineata]|uniref:UFM1 specific ligase 1 n=1 Tax=Leptinotarsa decemlineata TaxID=7539 RepID=UPI003D30D0A5
MTDWDEVKRLAADFQKVQLSSTTQRLSERNCIEIVSWLLDRKMIDLIFTSDGKEYLTPSQLVSDIRGELYDNGGRINLVDLAKTIGVDLAHINSHLNDVLKGHKDIQAVLGQLIDISYITRIAAEINEKLSQQGQINVSDLTILYDLPADFLQHQVLEKNLGKLIFGKQDKNDPKEFFTESFIARSKAKIKGALTGLTRPTPVSVIVNHIGLSEKIFFSLFEQSAMYGSLTGKLAGAQYIPNIYAKSQNEWVNHFYRQNGYIEFDALSRIGISDHKNYLKKQLSNEDYKTLDSCIVSKSILERIEADIDECIASKSFIDLQTNLPSVFNEIDEQMVLDTILSNQKRSQTIAINNFVISKAFVDELLKECDDLVKEKSKETVELGKYQQYQISLQAASIKFQKSDEIVEKVDKREERRKKAAGGKSGGGTQGRETKTKSTKKASRAGNRNNSESDSVDFEEKRAALEVVSFDDVKGVILPILENEALDEEIIELLIRHLLPKLNENGLELAANIYATTVSDRTANRRQTHNELQNKLNTLVGDVRLYEKGLKLLPQDLQGQLSKYLLKTVCTDIVNEILNYVAAEQNSNVVTNNFNNDQRLKFVNELAPEYRTSLQPLVKSLTGQSIDEFMIAVESGLTSCSMILKKIDKKKDRTVVLNHKYQLLEELNKCEDVALVLHLATIVIFTTATQCMLHFSGKHLMGVLSFLKQYLNEEQALEMGAYHDFVTLMLSGGSESESAKEKLKERMSIIKSIANDFKKPGSEKS